jgi:hypothetical protein
MIASIGVFFVALALFAWCDHIVISRSKVAPDADSGLEGRTSQPAFQTASALRIPMAVVGFLALGAVLVLGGLENWATKRLLSQEAGNKTDDEAAAP